MFGEIELKAKQLLPNRRHFFEMKRSVSHEKVGMNQQKYEGLNEPIRLRASFSERTENLRICLPFAHHDCHSW
jgi:hypothetical protein